MTVEVIKPGLLTAFQDGGRAGYAHLGVGRSGAFDAPALRIANALCGNPRDTCGLEVTLLGPTLRFHADAWIAVTGAPLPVAIDGIAIPAWAPLPVRAGTTVTLGAMRKGCRSYLAVHGGFDVQSVLGSRSSDINAALGPNDGRALRTGDRLALAAEPGSGPFFAEGAGIHCSGASENEPDPGSLPKWWLDLRPWFDGDPQHALRLLPGSHLDNLTNISRKLLFSEKFIVQANSNRVGVRLTGPKLEWTSPIELISEGCVPGVLQLPPSGQPIAFGPECPVSGGYPRIGQIAAVDMPRLAQLRPGDALRFTQCTLDDALVALRRRERALENLENAIAARLQACT